MAQSSSSQAVVARKERPLSPHLQVYRPQITSVLALFHRLTGLGLVVGLVLLVVWLACLATGRGSYDLFVWYLKKPLGLVFLFGWSWAVFYHMCSGVRHLLWSAGLFVTIPGIDRTGYAVVGVSTLVTLLVWIKILGVCPWL